MGVNVTKAQTWPSILLATPVTRRGSSITGSPCWEVMEETTSSAQRHISTRPSSRPILKPISVAYFPPLRSTHWLEACCNRLITSSGGMQLARLVAHTKQEQPRSGVHKLPERRSGLPVSPQHPPPADS